MSKRRPKTLNKKTVARRNPHAHALRTSGLFRPKVEEDKAHYSRKKKHPKQDLDPEE